MAKVSDKKKDIAEVKKSLSLVAENKRIFAKKLIERAEFMEKTLNLLETQINNEGAVITATNGNGFDVVSEHPAQKSYNVMVGKYNAMVKTIIDMIPNDVSEDDELLKFIGGGAK